MEEPREPDQFWHPSTISSGCYRKAIYEFKGIPKSNPHDVRSSRVFRMGHIIHAFVQDAVMADPLVVVFYPEIKIHSLRLRITGHADGLVGIASDLESAIRLREWISQGWNPLTDDDPADPFITWLLLELKSKNSMAFKYVQTPAADHTEQSFMYMKILREEGGVSDDLSQAPVTIPPLGDRLTRALVSYISKDDMLVGEHTVLFTQAKDDRLMAKLAELEDHVEEGTLPDRLPLVAKGKTAALGKDYRCTYCPWLALCWQPGA